jgi:hypothetical protein
MCNMSNEVPQLFDWDQARNQPGDRWARAELNHSVVEFVAPTEYMVRPPQPAVYVFLIDVSHAAVQSGICSSPPFFLTVGLMSYAKKVWWPPQPVPSSKTSTVSRTRTIAQKSPLSASTPHYTFSLSLYVRPSFPDIQYNTIHPYSLEALIQICSSSPTSMTSSSPSRMTSLLTSPRHGPRLRDSLGGSTKCFRRIVFWGVRWAQLCRQDSS